MTISQQAAKVAERLARNPWWILAFALVISAVAGWATLQLPVYTSRQALLPKNTDVVNRLNAFLKNFGAASDLIVVLEGRPPVELEAYADELAAKLGAEPEIGHATAHIDLQFFLQHAFLMMPAERLDQFGSRFAKPATASVSSRVDGLDEYLRKAINWIKDHPPLADLNIDIRSAEENLEALAFFLDEWRRWLSADQAPDGLGWDRLLARHGAGATANGYFTSRDGSMLFLFVHPADPSEDFKVLGPFIDKVRAVAGELAEQSRVAGRSPPIVGMTGLPAIEYEEYVNIRKDITLVVLTSAALIVLLILVVVRSFRWAVIIFIPMGLGVLWSLGLALVTVGHLTIITAAFIAILFGLGADYGIFTSSRIAEERRLGKPLVEAIGTGIGSSFTAVLTAGGASLLIFGALATVDFPGFAELGVVAAKGVLMILISTWMVQPALYALLPPKLKGLPVDGAPVKSADSIATTSGSFMGSGSFPLPAAVAIVVVAVGCAGFGVRKGLSIPFDYDVLSMLPSDSQAAHYQRRMVAESDYQAEVVIFTARDMAEARRITAEAGKFKSIAQVQSLASLFPEDAEARIRQANSIGESAARAGYARQIDELKRTGLPEKSFGLLRSVIDGSLALIDESQEQAFSSGHSNLVKSLENVREKLEAVQSAMSQDRTLARERSEMFLRALLSGAESGLKVIDTWRQAKPLTPEQLPSTLRDRFFASDGSIAVYAFPAKTVYDPENLDQLMKDVYTISPNATGFPTTHQVFSKSVVESFAQGTLLALAVCLTWIVLVLRSVSGFTLAALPLLIGGGWMLGLMSLTRIQYNYANIIALPLVIALAVDYGVWFSYRWRELQGYTPFQITMASGKVIALAAGTELAGLGAITLASYRGVSTMGVSITIGLLCCLAATLIVAPAIGQLIDRRKKQ